MAAAAAALLSLSRFPCVDKHFARFSLLYTDQWVEMSSRKFFKTNQSANKRILRSSSQKSKRHRPSEDEPPIENTREESSDDSGLSDHESSTSIFSDEFDDNVSNYDSFCSLI